MLNEEHGLIDPVWIPLLAFTGKSGFVTWGEYEPINCVAWHFNLPKQFPSSQWINLVSRLHELDSHPLFLRHSVDDLVVCYWIGNKKYYCNEMDRAVFWSEVVALSRLYFTDRRIFMSVLKQQEQAGNWKIIKATHLIVDICVQIARWAKKTEAQRKILRPFVQQMVEKVDKERRLFGLERMPEQVVGLFLPLPSYVAGSFSNLSLYDLLNDVAQHLRFPSNSDLSLSNDQLSMCSEARKDLQVHLYFLNLFALAGLVQGDYSIEEKLFGAAQIFQKCLLMERKYSIGFGKKGKRKKIRLITDETFNFQYDAFRYTEWKKRYSHIELTDIITDEACRKLGRSLGIFVPFACITRVLDDIKTHFGELRESQIETITLVNVVCSVFDELVSCFKMATASFGVDTSVYRYDKDCQLKDQEVPSWDYLQAVIKASAYEIPGESEFYLFSLLWRILNDVPTRFDMHFTNYAYRECIKDFFKKYDPLKLRLNLGVLMSSLLGIGQLGVELRAMKVLSENPDLESQIIQAVQ